VAAQILGRDRKTQTDDIATGHCAYVPEAEGNLRLWSKEDMVAELYFMGLRAERYTVRIAGALASRLRRAMNDYPEAPLLALLTLENGNRLAMPIDRVDLLQGYNSGCTIRETLVVDVRNLRARLDRMIEAAGQIVGSLDDD
jgi:hypothetical protein